jgi:hypothetical protein
MVKREVLPNPMSTAVLKQNNSGNLIHAGLFSLEGEAVSVRSENRAGCGRA